MTKLYAFLLGMYEFRMNFTTYILHPDSVRAYDSGRKWAHRLTFKRFEPSKHSNHNHLLRYFKK